MSRFFEFLKKIDAETPAPTSGAVWEKAQDTPEAWRILSVLHPPQNGGQSQYGEPIFQLSQAGFEEVHLDAETRLVFHTDPSGAAADRFRLLRMHLQLLQASGTLKSLLITSAQSEEGKSTIALNLATALAEGGKHKVLLLEADLHHSNLCRRLGLQARFGLAEYLESGTDPI
jgi:Mrp family chromosome partitioning ATPase